MNKKAILPEESIKIILAVIILVFLIYLAVSLYQITTAKNQSYKLQTILDIILKKASTLPIGEKTDLSIQGYGTKMYLAHFSDENKLCICLDNYDKDSCKNKGYCKNTNLNIKLIPFEETYYIEYLDLSQVINKVNFENRNGQIILSATKLAKNSEISEEELLKFLNSRPTEICMDYLKIISNQDIIDLYEKNNDKNMSFFVYYSYNTDKVKSDIAFNFIIGCLNSYNQNIPENDLCIRFYRKNSNNLDILTCNPLTDYGDHTTKFLYSENNEIKIIDAPKNEGSWRLLTDKNPGKTLVEARLQ